MEGTQVVSMPTGRPMTWADVMADRVARGLERPRASRRGKRAKVIKAGKAGPASLGTDSDPRMLSNTKVHTEPVYSGGRLTAAQAKAERKRRMMACGCRLCSLCLYPPMNDAEAERFGIVYLGLSGLRAQMGWDENDKQEDCGRAFDKGRAAMDAILKEEDRASEAAVLKLVRARGSGMGAMRVDREGNRLVWDSHFNNVLAEGRSWAEVLSKLTAPKAGKAAA